MNEILNKISAIGIVPVVKIEDAQKAVPLAKALCDGGLPCAEITFRTEQAEESIRRITKELPQMVVGAGTVLTVDRVKSAVAAGASFIVSPGLNPEVVGYCVKNGIPIVPGCANPSDIEQALSFGLDTVKFFPAEAAGGINMIKSMAALYGNVKFMPTGGISQKNLNEYLSFGRVIACGGSWMATEDLVASGDFEKITALTREAVACMLGFELAHIGINAESTEEAAETAQLFSKAFGFAYKPGAGSDFAGSAAEVLKKPGLGKKGHIAIRTNYIHRAATHLALQGFELDMNAVKHDDNGNIVAIYLKQEFGGFAVHLLQK